MPTYPLDLSLLAVLALSSLAGAQTSPVEARWILRPGSDIYIVYTHDWQDDPVRSRFATLDRRVASKVLYTHRF